MNRINSDSFIHLAADLNWTPPRWAGEALPFIGGDLQTLSSVIDPKMAKNRNASAKTNSRSVFVEMGDGDQLLMKIDDPDKKADTQRPVLMLVHGLTGCSESTHILQFAHAADAAGWQVVRVNMRGAGDGRPFARLSYNAAAGGDLAKASRDIARLFPHQPIIMVAVSLGGAAALNMAIEETDLPLSGLAVISAPVDMLDCSATFHKRRNFPYMRYILRGLQKMAETSPDLPKPMLKKAMAARSVWDFDEAVTAPLHGYPDARRYYQRASTATRLDQLNMPCLILHAQNDIWIPAEPLLSATPGPQTSIVVASGGGHVGFRQTSGLWHSGLWHSGLWHIDTALSWAAAMLP